jgi:hypothetical protein
MKALIYCEIENIGRTGNLETARMTWLVLGIPVLSYVREFHTGYSVSI